MNAYEKQQGKDVVLNGGLVVFAIAWMLFAAIGGRTPAAAPVATQGVDASVHILVPHEGSGAQPVQPLAGAPGAASHRT